MSIPVKLVRSGNFTNLSKNTFDRIVDFSKDHNLTINSVHFNEKSCVAIFKEDKSLTEFFFSLSNKKASRAIFKRKSSLFYELEEPKESIETEENSLQLLTIYIALPSFLMEEEELSIEKTF